MKIRRTEFAMVPTWVALHPEMRGHGTRIAVYVGVRIASFQFPDFEWHSERDLAEQVSHFAGCGAEACRKHIRAMRAAGIITGDHGELITPDDRPIGYESGDSGPHRGDSRPQTGDSGPHSPSIREKESSPPNGGVVGESEPVETDAAAEARAMAAGFWDRVKADTGHAPIGIKFMALAKLIEPFLRAGYFPSDVKHAVWAVYSERRPWGLATIEQYLDGRLTPRQRGSGKHLDALAAAIETERRRQSSA